VNVGMVTSDLRTMLLRGFEEGINGRNYAVFEELLAPDYTNHSMPGPGGAAGFRQIIESFVSAFPDMRITVEDVIVDGNRAATRGSWHGTHQGEFMGIPPTGKSVTVPYIDIWTLRDGKLADNWVQMDLLGMMTQLGVLPGPQN
jgi:steroid delta-isomerase-like uncharacterized protein